MEPEERPPTPGITCGPPSLNSAQNPASNGALQSSCDGPSWSQSPGGDDGPSSAEPGPTDIPHSLSRDADSQSEPPDGDELPSIPGPHGPAPHSPGSPSAAPLRRDAVNGPEAEKQRLNSAASSSVEERDDIKESTKSEEATADLSGQTPRTPPQEETQPSISGSGSLLEDPPAVPEQNVCKGKPKQEEGLQDNEEEERPKGEETQEGGGDVYSFPGDSDVEHLPPSSWTRCTFIQRCGRKRVQLRPFSGVATRRRTSQESTTPAAPGALPMGGGGVYDFKEEEEIKVMDGEEESASEKQIFTCVECSIYFRKQVHLQEHMVEHRQGGAEQGGALGKDTGFQCRDCGWSLPHQPALEDHQLRHQESGLRILKEIEKLKENTRSFQALQAPPLSPDADQSGFKADPRPSNVVHRRAGNAARRRLVCTQCNFSTRTSQALANHSKIHNRKKAPLLQADSPTAPRGLASTSLACAHCAFVTSSKAILREHQARVHAGRPHGDESEDVAAPPSPPEPQGSSETAASADSEKGKRQRGVAAAGGGAVGEDGVTHQVIHKFTRNRRFSRRGKIWADLTLLEPGLDGGREEEEEEEQEEQEEEHEEQEEELGNRDGGATLSLTARKVLKDGEEGDEDKDGEVVFLRRSPRVSAAAAASDSDVDEDFLDEDGDETAKGVERKCPYCPDRFHNGIGLANHVRGHLNRVGVSYNVRHFISAEEVNAIERKVSYQRKKKKVANFDPDTFSVMRCEFCSAGFDTRAGLSSHARAHLRDFGITNWDVTVSPIHILRELFSRRPDLVIPTAPPLSAEDEDEEESDGGEEEEEGGVQVKLEEERRERSVSLWEAPPPAPPVHREDGGGFDESDGDGGDDDDDDDDEAAEEEDDDEDERRLSPRKTEEEDGGGVDVLKCEVCDARFETRRGLARHARSHPAQLGVARHQRAKESSPGRTHPSPPFRTPSASPKDEEVEDMDLDKKPLPLSLLAKAAPPPSSSSALTPSLGASPARSASPPPVVKKAPISSLLPASSPLRALDHKGAGLKSLTSSLGGVSAGKPLWAPRDDDAPLNLTLEGDPSKDIVCQLCGAWFETRKGLSSHARAHLRHFGVEYSESKGSPIDLLHQLLDSDHFKHKALQLDLPPPDPPRSSRPSLLTLSSSSSSSSSCSSLAPAAKRPRSSSMQVFRLSSGQLMALPHSEPVKEIGCEFCGEYFENRKGLSSHARSHLRQMGITEWSVNGSPIDTLREVITRRGLPCALPLKPLKTPPPSSPGPPRSPLSSSPSPSSTFAGRLPFAFARPSSPPRSPMKSGVARAGSPGGPVLQLKPEPVQVEVSATGSLEESPAAESLTSSWGAAHNVFPLSFAVSREAEPTRDIRCEFCGEYFENRKGLSSHARSHLRQMGITEWSVNGSPIDTLREVMHKRGLGGPSGSDHGVKKEWSQGAGGHRWDDAAFSFQSPKYRKSPLSLLQAGSRGTGKHAPAHSSPAGKLFRMSPLAKRPPSVDGQTADREHPSLTPIKSFSFSPEFSFKKKPSPDKHRHQDPSCELCGFYFENRKALASHARAHLRQFGVTEWCVNGSPIETLSAWIRSRPQKVLEMHRSYMQGSRSALKKKSSSPLAASAESDHCLPVSLPKAPPSSSSSSSSSSLWSSSLTASLGRPRSRDVKPGSSKTANDWSKVSSGKGGRSSPGLSWLATGSFPPQAQVARSELNVRLPRGCERRPVKPPSCTDGPERDSGPPKAPRTGTVPALVPKPPSYPLVKLVGKFYTLKCRFCEVEFHGPLSVQEDWIRHLQQHILHINYEKPRPPAAAAQGSASTSRSSASSTPALASSPSRRSLTPLLAPENTPSLALPPVPLPTPTA